MITGRRSSFESRCRERGFTLDQVRQCIVSEDGELITVDETHPAYPRAVPAVPPKAGGPGTELKKLLARIGITASQGCACNRRAQTMDANGPDWCEQNIGVISDWLAEEASRRRLPYLSAAGHAIIRMAIRRARANG